MANIPSAEASPRIENGVLYWYAGDTGTIVFEVNLTDQDGEPLTIDADDVFDVIFYDCRKQIVQQFENPDTLTVTDNQISMDFDDTVTANFTKGHYTYDVIYTRDSDGKVSTLAKDNEVVVL